MKPLAARGFARPLTAPSTVAPHLSVTDRFRIEVRKFQTPLLGTPKAPLTHVGHGGTLVTVRATDEMAIEVEHILEHGTTRPRVSTPAPAMSEAAPSRPAAAAATGTTAITPASAGDTLQVVKESLVVGKREVENGGVRITSHVSETPVEKRVTLHEERIVVDRRPVNRPLIGSAADAFRDRTLSATARSEQAVVHKEARVIEEIGLHKEATDRVENVQATVRETHVDVEQVTGGSVRPNGSPMNADTRPGTLRDNVATRAVDHALTTNVSGENPGRNA